MAGVQIVQSHRPRISDAIGTLAATLQGRRDTEQARADAQAKTKASALMQFAINKGATPEQWNLMRSHLASTDPDAAGLIPDIASLPPDQYEEAKRHLGITQTQIQQKSADAMLGGTASATDPTLAFNTSEVGKEPFRQQQLYDVLKGGTGASPQQEQAAAVENKIAPTADVALREQTEGPLRVAQTGEADVRTKQLIPAQAKEATVRATQGIPASAAKDIAEAGKARAEAGAISASSQPTATSGLVGDDFLKSLPQSEARLVKSIADYTVDPTKVASLRNPKDAGSERNRLIKEVLQYDPTYDMTQFPSKNKLRTDFNSGAGAKNIRSINTALKHLDSLAEAGGELSNVGGLPLVTTGVNFLKNMAGQLSGNPAKVKFDAAATAVDNELAAVFKGTGATDQEINQWRGSLNSSMSPEQLAAAIKERLELLGGRLSTLKAQYEQGMGKPADFKILSDPSRKVLAKFGVDADAFESGTVSGGPAAGSSSKRMSKEQVNTKTGERRTVFSDDGGATWHP